MARIRVCQLITELRLAGAERMVYELSHRLDRDLFEVHVAALRGGQVAGMLAAKGVPVTVLDVCCKFDAAALGRLVGLLRSRRIDLLHTHLFHADLAGRIGAWLAGVPHLVHTVHVAEERFRPWQFAFSRLTAGSCERIVCVSRSVLEHHMRRSSLPRWRYELIPNGIDAAAFARDDQARQRLRRQWGIGDDRVLLAFVGRLDHQKGIDVLLSAMAHLAARGNPVDAVIAGDGPMRRMVENFVSHGEGGRCVRYLGFTHDVRSLLSAADILAMPSRWEGWPLALAEAMAAGLPVIGARVAGVVDLIDNGTTGLLFDRQDSVGLAEVIERLIGDADLRRRLGAAAKHKAATNYGLEANILAHQRLYTQIAGCP